MPGCVTAGSGVPFLYTTYPVTPTLSVEGDQVSAMLDLVAPATARLPGCVGEVVSLGGGGGVGQAAVAALTVTIPEWLPTASYASTPNA